jgi:uncharacterized protein YacL
LSIRKQKQTEHYYRVECTHFAVVSIRWKPKGDSVLSKIRDFVRFHMKRGFKFAVVGSLGAIINLFVLFLLTEYGKMWYILSEILAIFVAFVFNYFINTYWTYLDAMKALQKVEGNDQKE